MPGTGLPKNGRRKRRRRSGEGGISDRGRKGQRNRVLGWTFLLAWAAVLLLVFTVWMWVMPKISSKNALVTREPELAKRVVSKFPSPSEQEALAMVKQALSIRNAAEIGGYFRPCDSSPEEIVVFLQGLETLDGQIAGDQWLSSMDANGLSIDGVAVNFRNEAAPRSRLAFLTPDAEGKWLIDYDSFARTVKPSWDEILEKGATRALVRVMLAKDSYHNGPFRDDKEWICYGMASPDMERILYGYCKVGSPQAAALDWVFTKEAKLNRATLEIRRVEDGGARQFEISKVVAEDWVVSDVTFEAGFE